MKKMNPAVRSLGTIAVYLVALIAVWLFLGRMLFPQTSRADATASFVSANAPLLTQLAEAAENDAEMLALMRADSNVSQILSAGGVGAIFADERGVVFSLEGKGVPDNGYLYLLYCPGGYTFGRTGNWNESRSGSTVTYAGGDAVYRVTSLSGPFWLEEYVSSVQR